VIQAQSVDVRVTGPDLQIVLSSSTGRSELLEQIGGWENLGGEAVTSDDRRLKLQDGNVSKIESGNLLEGEVDRVTLKFRKWSLEDDAQSSVAWIAPVELPSGAGFEVGSGNLVFFAEDDDQTTFLSTGHLYLEGANQYVILRRNKNVGLTHEWLVIEPLGQQAPNQELLREEFRLLQFTLGIGASVGMVRGVTETLESRTALSIRSHGLQSNVPDWAEAPVPLKDRTWIRPFFKKLSDELATTETDRGKSAVHMFLNALASLDTDTTIILMASALRTLAREYAVANDLIRDAGLISQAQGWREWVQARQSQITDFGVSDWLTLKERIIDSAQPQILDLLNASCSHAGLEPDSRLLEYVSEVHTDFERRGWTSEAASEDFDRQVATANLFVALLGALVEYEGEIGYRRPYGDFFDRVQLGNTKGDKPEAERLFSEEISLSERDQVKWPDYELPTLPDIDLIQDLAAFASDLRARTEGRVTASLQPSISRTSVREEERDSEIHHLRFVLRLTEDPSKQITPFDVHIGEDDKLLYIEGWKSNSLSISTTEELIQFKQEIAQSDKMRRYIQQLLLTLENMNR
jgi:hypothetical protein